MQQDYEQLDAEPARGEEEERAACLRHLELERAEGESPSGTIASQQLVHKSEAYNSLIMTFATESFHYLFRIWVQLSNVMTAQLMTRSTAIPCWD